MQVLKLDQAVGKAMLRRCTELLNHLQMLFACQTLLFSALHQDQSQLLQLACNKRICKDRLLLAVHNACAHDECSVRIREAGCRLVHSVKHVMQVKIGLQNH